jgi:hypothetical protein
MEFEIDCDIIGEILIPLENNLNQNNQNNPSFSTNSKKSILNPFAFPLQSILEKNYKDFRSIMFQGELLRLFLVLKLEKTKDLNIEEFMNEIYIKFEFDSSCDHAESELKKTDDINLQGNLSSSNTVYDENDSSQLMTEEGQMNFSDMFSLQRNSLFNKFRLQGEDAEGSNFSNNSKYNYKNKNYDFISRKLYLEEQNIIIFEVIRHIIVPNKFLNKNLIMKLNIMKKNDLDYLKGYSLTEVFSSGAYEGLKEFTILKTLFKEVKIIRPLFISKTRQVDILPDTSLLQIKIENITSSINFIDKNLKLSKFLKQNLKSYLEEPIGHKSDDDVLNFGINLTIKDIQFLKEETVVDKKMTINVKSLEQYSNGLSREIPLNDVNFELLNDKNDFPIEIKPGEEVVLTMKIHKSAFIYENLIQAPGVSLPDGANNKPSENYSVNQYSTLSTFSNFKETQTLTLANKELNVQTNYYTNTLSNNLILTNNTKSPLNKQSTLKNFNFFKKNSIVNQYMSTTTNSNLGSYVPLPTSAPVVHKYSFNNFNNGVTPSRSIEDVGAVQNNLDENDEIIKVMLSTPLILNITSFKFYDSLFMSIPIKWQNEITRFIKVQIEIQEEIILHEYFNVYLIAKNISNSPMDLSVEISDSASDFINSQTGLETEILDYKGKR